MRSLFAFLIVGLSIGSALAESPLSGAWIDEVTMGGGPSAPDAHHDGYLIDFISLGNLQLGLETSSMADIAFFLGGEVQHWGEAGGAVTWLCYAQGATTIWLYSDGEMGDGKLTGVGVDTRQPAPAAAECAPFPSEDFALSFHEAGLGASVDEVRHRFGHNEPDKDGLFSYWSFAAIPGHATFEAWQQLTFRESDGVIDAFAVIQQTGD